MFYDIQLSSLKVFPVHFKQKHKKICISVTHQLATSKRYKLLKIFTEPIISFVLIDVKCFLNDLNILFVLLLLIWKEKIKVNKKLHMIESFRLPPPIRRKNKHGTGGKNRYRQKCIM